MKKVLPAIAFAVTLAYCNPPKQTTTETTTDTTVNPSGNMNQSTTDTSRSGMTSDTSTMRRDSLQRR